MKYKFIAPEIEILNFSTQPDSSGMSIPSHAVVDFKAAKRVYYGSEDNQRIVGTVRLRRVENGIVADFTLHSIMKDVAKAEVLIRKLYPATSFIVHGFNGHSIFHLEIVEVFLTPNGNEDLTIKPLGDRLVRRMKPKEMH